ncbi:hypothetical protein [Skermanella pratensis]|uniref:hypothetical protein n=1 Tax=Skermanella pratensis TaxID=2233999 RepID=UPI0013013DF2|nr:hypothetical protein [Skermanella pratensis]
MKDDQNSGKDNGPYLLGQALSGRHLLDSPGPSNDIDNAGPRRPDGDTYLRSPRPLPRRPNRRIDPRGLSDRPIGPDRSAGIPDRTAAERISAAASAMQADHDFDLDDDDDSDDLNSNGLVSRSGCPRGWLISEAELARRFARMGGRFEDIEVDTELDRPAVAAKPAQPAPRDAACSSSYTSLFDLPRRPPLRSADQASLRQGLETSRRRRVSFSGNRPHGKRKWICRTTLPWHPAASPSSPGRPAASASPRHSVSRRSA